MRKLTSWTTRIAVVFVAAGGVVAACYNEVPGPSAPLPPTREVSPHGPKPQPIEETPISAGDAGVSPVMEMKAEMKPSQSPKHTPHDGGVADVIDLPPVPDADIIIDAPMHEK